MGLRASESPSVLMSLYDEPILLMLLGILFIVPFAIALLITVFLRRKREINRQKEAFENLEKELGSSKDNKET